jgi:hypothetical protein
MAAGLLTAAVGLWLWQGTADDRARLTERRRTPRHEWSRRHERSTAMNTSSTRRPGNVPFVLGLLLMAGGGLAAIATAAGVDISELINEESWPFLVVVPGLVLLALAVIPTPPQGQGFVVAGSIFMTVGLILLYQATTDAWASWAYAWALIPGAASLGKAVYGLLTGYRDLARNGVQRMLIAGGLFVVGWWYFEAWFATGHEPSAIGTWWPAIFIGVGAVIGAGARSDRRRGPGSGSGRERPTEGTRQ